MTKGIEIPSGSNENIAFFETNRFTRPWWRYFYEIWVRLGSGVPNTLPLRLNIGTTPVGSVNASQTDLITYNLIANTLVATNDTIEIIATGTFASNTNTKQVILQFGNTTLFDTGGATFNGGSWVIKSLVTLNIAGVLQATSNFFGNTNLVPVTSQYVEPVEDITQDLTIKCTGLGVVDNDIIQQTLSIYLVKGS